MAKVIRSPKAEKDLGEIARHIAKDSPTTAIRFLDAAEAAFPLLSENPEIAGRLESANPRLAGLRIWPMTDFRNHAIIYRLSGETVEIVRVIHAARDLGRI